MGTFRPGWLSCRTATVTSVPLSWPKSSKVGAVGWCERPGAAGPLSPSVPKQGLVEGEPSALPQNAAFGHQMRVGDAAWCGVQVRAELLPSALRMLLWWPAGSSLSCSVFAVVGATAWLVLCPLYHSCWGWAVVVGSPPFCPISPAQLSSKAWCGLCRQPRVGSTGHCGFWW